MTTPWLAVELGQVLQPVSRPESVDPAKTYRLLGAHWYAQGLYIKDTSAGSSIAAPRLYRVERGDFVYNRLFAWKGSFAVAAQEQHGCYVSNEFPCFIVDQTRLVPAFLWRFFSRETVWAEALGLSTGGTPTSRNRLKEERFLAMRVALPPLEEQRRIVAKLDTVVANVLTARQSRDQQESELQRLLMAAYFRIAKDAPRKPLGEIAPLCRRPVAVEANRNYPQVAVRSFGRGSFHKPALAGSEVTWQKPFLVRSGDILLSNIKAWEGAVAVARQEDDQRVASHRYLTCVPVPGVATAEFVCFHLLSPEGLSRLGEASPGSADRNRTLGSKSLLAIPVPVPPISLQKWFNSLIGWAGKLEALVAATQRELDALLPAILDRAFRGEL
jgi:type I restriction enzyme, S subunit